MAPPSNKSTEKNIERVLNLLTTAPKAPEPTEPALEPIFSMATEGAAKSPMKRRSLREGSARSRPTESMRRIVKTKNVVAVGISEKVSKGKRTGKLALTFYVERKISPKKLREDEAVPPTVSAALSGPEAIPTDVVVLGKLRPQINAIKNPLQPGNSIGHVDITAGTLGAVVTKG